MRKRSCIVDENRSLTVAARIGEGVYSHTVAARIFRTLLMHTLTRQPLFDYEFHCVGEAIDLARR